MHLLHTSVLMDVATPRGGEYKVDKYDLFPVHQMRTHNYFKYSQLTVHTLSVPN